MRHISTSGRRLVILADGYLNFHFGKTAIGVLRYRAEDVVAVIDRESSGRDTQAVLGVGGQTPIVTTLTEALQYRPDALLVGVATRGGTIPDEWRPVLRAAVDHRLDLICGLHEFLSDDPKLARAAEAAGVQLIDVRKPAADLTVAGYRPHRSGSTVVTMVGSDCAVGKMSVALDVEAEAKRRQIDMHFVATGQTGMMIAGNGIPLDRIIGDFMAGAVEGAVRDAAGSHDVVLVEGQGSLFHPAYSGVTLALIHGSQPDAMILVFKPAVDMIEDYPVPIPPVLQLVETYETAAGWVKPASVIAVAVNSHGLPSEQARRIVEHISIETGLPATDAFLFGAGPLVDAIETFRNERR